MDKVRNCSVILQWCANGEESTLFDYLQETTYTDPASGSSDELQITLFNVDLEWMKDKAPKLGDRVKAFFDLMNWNGLRDNHQLLCGQFLVDDVEYSGNSSECIVACVSKPADTSWATRQRTQVWENATLAGIAGELAGRSGLSLSYKAPTIDIAKVEQSQKTDQAFLEELCEEHDLGMKVFETKLVIFDWGDMEDQDPIAKLSPERQDFVENAFDYHDTLAGVYTGAEIAYKNGDDGEEIKLTIGDPARQLYINETVDNAAEADKIARARVNQSNRTATTFSADLWPREDITSGVVIELEDMGVANGRYFVDVCTITVGSSGTQMSIETHKCQQRL